MRPGHGGQGVARGTAYRRESGGGETTRGVHASAVGFVAFEQRLDVGDAEAASQFLIHALATLAAELCLKVGYDGMKRVAYS